MNKDERRMVQLISDLGRLNGKKITVTFIDGRMVTGRLSAFDEAANCILKKCDDWEYGNTVICLGRSILLICPNTPHIL